DMVNKDVTEAIDLASGLTVREDFRNANHEDKLGNIYIGTDHLSFGYDLAHMMLPATNATSMDVSKIIPVMNNVQPVVPPAPLQISTGTSEIRDGVVTNTTIDTLKGETRYEKTLPSARNRIEGIIRYFNDEGASVAADQTHSYTVSAENLTFNKEEDNPSTVKLQITKDGRLAGKFEKPLDVSPRSILSQLNNTSTRLGQPWIFKLNDLTVRAQMVEDRLDPTGSYEKASLVAEDEDGVIRNVAQLFFSPIYENGQFKHTGTVVFGWESMTNRPLYYFDFPDSHDHSKINIFDAAGKPIGLVGTVNVLGTNWIPVSNARTEAGTITAAGNSAYQR
ncbi:MAG TPA: hypothetical protein VNZ86_13945, partial [Bacteroidia bacterium]|nr:hypothetical protein [Bacteroidia bacterium]